MSPRKSLVDLHWAIKGGFSTKLHLRTERVGKPVCWTLTPGQRQEATRYDKLEETFHALLTIAAILRWIPV